MVVQQSTQGYERQQLGQSKPEFSTAMVEDFSLELLRPKSYAIKNQLRHPNPLSRGFAPPWFFMV